MAWVGVITNAGNAVLSNWLDGTTCNIVSAAGGSGTVKEAALLAQTELAEQQQTASLVACQKVEGGYKLRLQFAAAETEYTLKQIGVWANIDGGDNVLLAVYQDEVGITIRSKDDFPDFAYTFFGVLAIGNTGQLAVNVDASAAVTYATLQEALASYLQLDQSGKIPDDLLPDMDYIPSSAKGVAGGVPILGADGKIPNNQLDLDGALSDTSDKPVKNSIIQAALTSLSNALTNAVNSINQALSGKAASNHSHTAAQVGAAASNHTHTAAQVGAAASNHTHTAAQVGAAASNHTHNVADLGGCRIVIGSYTGNGVTAGWNGSALTGGQLINLGAKPKAVILHSHLYAGKTAEPTYSAAFVTDVSSAAYLARISASNELNGFFITNNGFVVSQYRSTGYNVQDYFYTYIAII